MRVFGFAGYSGCGKTTLIEKVTPLLIAGGAVVSLIKHAHHAFEIDLPGKDSRRHREAGCAEVLVSSARRWALIHELRGAPEDDLFAHLRRLSKCDLALVEGYKNAPIPKMEIRRAALNAPPIADDSVVAVAADFVPPLPAGVAFFDLNDAAGVAAFVRENARPPPNPRGGR